MSPGAALGLLLAYVVGSLTFATILVRVATGRDVRSLGSGNAGATNVLRTSGKSLALAVLLLDALKGVFGASLLAVLTHDARYTAAGGFAAVLGHVFPCFFQFRGGKGVATAVGAFAVIAPVPLAAMFVVFGLLVALTRYVSLGSVTTAVLMPFVVAGWQRSFGPTFLAAAAIALLLVFSHRANLVRLYRGEERKLGRKEPAR